MTTPIEDRVAALELWKTGTVDPALVQAQQAITNLRNRVTTLEAEYADAVARFQKADDLAHRLVRLLHLIRSSTGSLTDNDLARLPEDERRAIAQQREVDDSADEWRTAVFR
jgi:hypothetical protein